MPSKAEMTGTDAERNAATDALPGDQWEAVHAAIHARWPSISREELKSCPCTVGDLANYVAQRVDAGHDEIESVVAESAGQTRSALRAMVDPITQRAQQASQHVTGPIHSAFERIQYEADESPLKTSLATLVLGFGLGVLATALYLQSDREPSAWQQLKKKRLYSRR